MLLPALSTTILLAVTSTGAADLDARIDALVTRSGLTADEVAERAVETSFALESRRAQVLAAAAEVDKALAAYWPRLTAGARYTRLSGADQGPPISLVAAPGQPEGPLAPGATLVNVPFTFPVLVDQTAFEVSLSAPVSDYVLHIPRLHAAAEKGERAARHQEEAERRRVALDGRLLYYAWVRAELQRIVASEAHAQANLHLDDARAAEAIGTASRADVLAVEARVASSELLLARADTLVERLQDQLRIAMHDAPGASYRVGEDVRHDRPSPLDGAPQAELRDEALSARPEVAALAEAIAAFDDRQAALRIRYFPRVDAFADASYANPSPRAFPQEDRFSGSWSAGARLTWTPSEIPAIAAESRRIEALGLETAARLDALRDAIQLEVASAQQELKEAKASTASAAKGVAAAQEAHRVRRALFRAGRATSVELTDAELDLTRARLDAINARLDLAVARVRLAHAVGR